MPDAVTGFVTPPARAAELLNCVPSLVDVQACGPEYVAFSIFDYEGETNPSAMAALSEISGYGYDIKDEDQVLAGPVLIVYKN